VLWDQYLLTVSKYTVIATNFDYVLNEPSYWDYSGAEDPQVSLDTMIERCLTLAHRSPIQEGNSMWTPISWNEVDENIAIGSRLRYGRGKKPVVHHFGGVSV
jgi:hypothetical protein